MGLVESLLNLYHVDVQVRGLRSRLTSAERYLSGQTKQVDDLGVQKQELQTRRRQLQAATGNLEVELKTFDDRLEKLRNELNSSVNNKQYAVLLAEMKIVKTSRGAVEDRMLADMEQIEKLQEQLKALEAQIADRQRIQEIARTQLEERRSDVGQRLEELETERRQAAAVVPVQTLVIFDELADNFEGEAMAQIEEIDRRHREYACGACNMHLPFEQISVLSSRNDSVVRCPSCTRILFMEGAMRETFVKK